MNNETTEQEAMDVSDGSLTEETTESGKVVLTVSPFCDVDVKDVFRSVLADVAETYVSSVENERNGLPDMFDFIASIDLGGIHLCVQVETSKEAVVDDLTNAFILKYYDKCLTTDLPHFLHLCKKGLKVQMKM